MRRPQVRPVIELVVELAPEHVLQCFRESLGKHGFRGSVLGSCIEVTVDDARRHFWSPQLSLQVHEHERGTLLYGRLGPQPEVWTMLVALYAIVGISSTFALFLAFSQWMLDEPLWALWALPLGLALTGMVYGTAYVGQRLGAEQSHELAEMLTQALGLAEDALRI